MDFGQETAFIYYVQNKSSSLSVKARPCLGIGIYQSNIYHDDDRKLEVPLKRNRTI